MADYCLIYCSIILESEMRWLARPCEDFAKQPLLFFQYCILAEHVDDVHSDGDGRRTGRCARLRLHVQLWRA